MTLLVTYVLMQTCCQTTNEMGGHVHIAYSGI